MGVGVDPGGSEVHDSVPRTKPYADVNIPIFMRPFSPSLSLTLFSQVFPLSSSCSVIHSTWSFKATLCRNCPKLGC